MKPSTGPYAQTQLAAQSLFRLLDDAEVPDIHRIGNDRDSFLGDTAGLNILRQSGADRGDGVRALQHVRFQGTRA